MSQISVLAFFHCVYGIQEYKTGFYVGELGFCFTSDLLVEPEAVRNE